MDIEQQAAVFKALADPTRLRIMQLLPAEARCGQMYSVGELVEAVGGSQPNMSRHLHVLKAAGLIKCRKACSSVYYWKVPETFEQVQRLLGQISGAR